MSRNSTRQWWDQIRASRILVGGAILMLLSACGVASTDGGGGSGAGARGWGGFGGTEMMPDEWGIEGDEKFDRRDEETAVIAAPASAIACTANNQCPTALCVDGFCCDAKCDNKCMACSAAKKGGGADGICGSIKYDTDPDNDCPYGACDGKNQCKNYNGFSCTAAPQCLSNYCVDGICCGNICMGACQACTAAKKGGGTNGVCGNIAVNTDPDNECNPGECNGSGACNASPQPTSANGASCTSAAQCASGFCADGVCCDSWCLGTCQACTAVKKNQGVDGVCGPIANDKDPDDECWGGACNGIGVCKQYNGVPCSDKTQCLSGYCVDGTCCGNICTQLCYACSEAKKGQGFDGVCAPIASGFDAENECNPGECNGAGACNQPQTLQDNGTTCVSGGQCASSHCVDGVCCDTLCNVACKACTAAKKGGGVDGTCGDVAAETDPDSDCGVGGQCGGNGMCRYYNGLPCAISAQCFSNYCVDAVCCGNICTSTCYACSAVKKGQGNDGSCGPIANTRDPDDECTPGECNGSGACNQAPVLQENGNACGLATQCISGFCADGVCCDAACTDTCTACTATKKGSGTDGTCGNIKYDADPDNECYAGSCSGSGTCQFYNGLACTQASECLSNYCVDGSCCGNICNGNCMACSAAKKGSGSDGACGAISVDTDPDDECPLGECNGTGVCTVRAANGTACTTDTECGSNHCIDGVCCDTTCTGTCVACDLPGKVGTCSNIDAGQSDPNGTPPCNDTCDGAGQCVQGPGAACTSGSQCSSHICNRLVCDAPKTVSGPLEWMTIPNDSNVGVTEIAASNNGQGMALVGFWTDSMLKGSFSADGVPLLSSYGGFGNQWAQYSHINVARGGAFAAYEMTDRFCPMPGQPCLYSCNVAVPPGIAGGPASFLIGQNDAGQVAAIVPASGNDCAPFTYGTIGSGDQLIRASNAGATELNMTVPAGIQLPIVLGPAGEFHWGSGASITKTDVNASTLWTKMATGSITSSAWDVDAAGNILIAVSFSGSIDYGAGAMAATGPRDLGLIKLDPAGNVVWQKHFGGGAFTMGTVKLTRTATGDMTVWGDHTGSINFGTGTLSGAKFIVKFDAAGNALWHVDLVSGGFLLVAGDISGAVYVSSPRFDQGGNNTNVDLGWGVINEFFVAKYH